MGASTILLMNYADCPLPVACIVLDSPFACFTELAEGLGSQMGIPKEMFNALFPMIEQQIKMVTGGMEIRSLRPIDKVGSLTFPALFIHGVDDTLIPMDHTERLYAAYGGSVKEVNYCEGDHNGMRPYDTLDLMFAFI
jgi:hypothetical protein